MIYDIIIYGISLILQWFMVLLYIYHAIKIYILLPQILQQLL